jgi:DNA repair exonuclease SbcCD nuclease subunit
MKPTAILTADWHLRETAPKCRTDDFWEAQWSKVQFISELQAEYDCPIYNSGDLFHHWKPSPRLISWCLEYLPFMYIIPGNHDLPNHNLDLLEKSGLWTLQMAGKIDIFECELGRHSGKVFNGEYQMAIIHKLINHPQTNATAKGLMKKLKGFDLILTGDNHETFTYTKTDGQLLVNPGSLTRQTAAQSDHKPCVVLWFAEDNSYERIYLPINKDVISREHIAKVEERDVRMEAFVNRLSDDYDIDLDFNKNIEAYFNNNRARKVVQDMVWESVEA